MSSGTPGILRLLIAMLAIMPLLAPAALGGETRPAGISVVMDDNYPPFSFRDDEGRVQGILIDQWRLFEAKAGVPVTIHAMDWGKAIARMRAGEFDVLDTVFKTEERQGWLDFTPPYAQLEVVIFFDREISGITDAASLHGFPVAVKAGDAAIDLLRRHGVANLLPFDSYEAIVLAAKERKVNVFVIDKPPAIHFLAKHGVLDRFNVSAPLDVGEFHRAVRRGDSALLARVQDGFARITAAEQEAIATRWYGSAAYDRRPLRIFAIVVGGLTLVLVVLFVWNHLLRTTVARRTAELEKSIGELHANTAFVRTLIDTIPDLIWLKNSDGVYLACNRTFERFFGASEARIIGKTDYDFVPRDLADLFRENDRKAMAAGRPNVNEEMITFADDGHRALLETIKMPMRSADGSLVGVLGIGRDITSHKQTENSLRESEARFRTMFNAAQDGILIAEAATRRFRFANPAICNLLGWREDELLTKRVDDIHPPTDLPRVQEHFARQLHGEISAVHGLPVLCKDGTVRFCDITAQLIVDQGVSCLMGMFHDVTEQRQVAERLRQAEKMQAVGQLAAGVAHDFNNMLAAILGTAELIERKLPGDSPLRHDLDLITQSAGRAGELTAKLLAFSRRSKAEAAPVDVHQVLRDTIVLLQNTSDRRIVIRQELEAPESEITGDAAQLQNALLNLGLNAVQAMPEGGTLTFATRTLAAPAAAGLAPGPCLEIRIRDTGKGIPAEHLPRIFEPFFTTKAPGQGTGLGLAVVFGTVQQHHGTIEVESTVGAGSCFRILLPLARAGTAPATAPATPTPPPSPGRGGRRILVADDEAVMRDILSAALGELGHQVQTATNGRQALAILAAQPRGFDLVILDQIMPEMNGRDCFAAMRQLVPDLPVILASGYIRDEDLAQMQANGLRGHIRKPFRIQELTEIISQALGDRRPG